jgi:hypothetical protein
MVSRRNFIGLSAAISATLMLGIHPTTAAGPHYPLLLYNHRITAERLSDHLSVLSASHYFAHLSRLITFHRHGAYLPESTLVLAFEGNQFDAVIPVLHHYQVSALFILPDKEQADSLLAKGMEVIYPDHPHVAAEINIPVINVQPEMSAAQVLHLIGV